MQTVPDKNCWGKRASDKKDETFSTNTASRSTPILVHAFPSAWRYCLHAPKLNKLSVMDVSNMVFRLDQNVPLTLDAQKITQ